MEDFKFTQNENMHKYDFKVVVLKRPYDNFEHDDLAKKLLTDIFKLKLNGYKAHYPYGILPISDFDFIANHICLCIQKDNELVPITAFKSITSSTCDEFRIPFPVVNHKFGKWKDSFEQFTSSIEKWSDDVIKEGRTPAYNASWTMAPNLEKNLRNIAREISMSLFYNYYSSEKITDIINSTSAKHNVHCIQENMGLHYMTDKNGDKLPYFESPIFYEEPFFLMYVDQRGFSKSFIKECFKYAALWENRLVIDNVPKEQSDKTAA